MEATTDASKRPRTGPSTIAIRVVVVIFLLPLGYYLGPRLVGLVELPDVLDSAAVHMRSYNPGLPEVAGFDRQTTAELAALDRIDAALGQVRAIDAASSASLRSLIAQIHGDVLPTLGRTDIDVDALVGSLDRLTRALRDLRDPVAHAASGLHHDRDRLANAIDIARAVAAHAHSARQAAVDAADDVSGPPR